MKKFPLLVASLFLCFSGLAFGGNPALQGKTLSEIHGASWPKSPDGNVTKNQCMMCHGDYTKLGEQTANLEPNPHNSHLGIVNCEDCHKVDQAKPVLMCNDCHNFTIRKKAK